MQVRSKIWSLLELSETPSLGRSHSTTDLAWPVEERSRREQVPRPQLLFDAFRRWGRSTLFPILAGVALVTGCSREAPPADAVATVQPAGVSVDFLESHATISIDPKAKTVRGTTTVR